MRLKKRFMALAALVGAVAAISTVALATITTTFNPAAAPTGTHVQTGTPSCSVSGLAVNCTGYELAGVGNANATGSLVASYSATVDCTNKGGNLVPVKSTAQTAPTTPGSLSPKNGKLSVPALSSSPVPTDEQFEAAATCPNGNWTKSVAGGTITLTSFTYTVHFVGFTGNYITITGP
jgi:hypothetical protein